MTNKRNPSICHQIMLCVFILWGALAISGCDSVSQWLQDRNNLGTTLGYSQCLKNNRDSALSEELIKTKCLSLHVRKIDARLGSKLSYDCVNEEGVCFIDPNAFVTNLSEDFIVTGIKISVSHVDNKDQKGNLISETASSCEDVWIEPQLSKLFLLCGLKFAPTGNRLSEGDKLLYSWKLLEVRGLKIKLN